VSLGFDQAALDRVLDDIAPQQRRGRRLPLRLSSRRAWGAAAMKGVTRAVFAMSVI
jgi:hypothetical protein